MEIEKSFSLEEKNEKINSEKIDPSGSIQILTKLLNDLQSSKIVVKKNEKELTDSSIHK